MQTVRRIISLSVALALSLNSLSLAIPLASAKGVDPEEKVYYYLHDHLGGVDAILDEEGNVVERRDYLPYGNERIAVRPNGNPDEAYGFTGKELDEETGLYYYGARYYDPDIGRFVSLDPLVLDESEKSLNSVLANPQALNGYSYVLNNPLRYVDLNGKWGSDVHLNLTMYLAEGAGFSPTDALTIGLYDQMVDTNPRTEPGLNMTNYISGITEEYHFLPYGEALEKVTMAIDRQELTGFGKALHTFQDTYAHTMSPSEHVFRNIMEYMGWEGADPDKTQYHPREAKLMAFNTFTLMRDYLKKDIIDEDELKQFDKKTQSLWKRIENTVYQFIESSDENKIDLLKEKEEDSE